MGERVTLELSPAAWPGSGQPVRFTANDSIAVDEIRWEVGARFTSELGRFRSLGTRRSSVPVARQLHRGEHIDVTVPLPTQPTDLGDGATGVSVDWFLTFTVATTDGSGDIEIPCDLVPAAAPPDTPVDTLVDTESAAASLKRHRRRTPVTSGWVWILAMPALAAAVGIPLGFAIGNTDDSQFLWSMSITIALWVAFALAAEVLYARADQYPFELDRSIVRRGTAAGIVFAAPPSEPMAARIVTRVLQQKLQTSTSRGTNKVDVVQWSAGSVIEIGASQVAAQLPIPIDAAPTVSHPTMNILRIEHWVRVQPASTVGSSLRFHRNRSDRPVIIVS